MTGDATGRDLAQWREVHVPVLVLGSWQDPTHPHGYAEILARELPSARLAELTPKSEDEGRHVADAQAAIAGFLSRVFPSLSAQEAAACGRGVSAVGLGAQTVRYRRADSRQRTQTKGVLLVIAGAYAGYAALYLLGVLLLASGRARLLYDLFGVPVFWLLALPIPVAMFTYRLFNVNVLINRTLVYGSLTVLLALIYFGGVAVTQAIVRAFTGQEEQPQLAIVASTLMIAALFNPFRSRIQAVVDRRFYRRKYDTRKTLEDFSAQMRDETDLDALSDDLLGMVRETMQPAHVSSWLRQETTLEREQPG